MSLQPCKLALLLLAAAVGTTTAQNQGTSTPVMRITTARSQELPPVSPPSVPLQQQQQHPVMPLPNPNLPPANPPSMGLPPSTGLPINTFPPVHSTPQPVPSSYGTTWWEPSVRAPMGIGGSSVELAIDSLIQLAIENSAQLSVYSDVPLIRETAINEADAAFDWTHFADALWEDISEPVGNSLTVGGTGDRFNDHNVSVTGGYRRRNTHGGNFEVSQRFGHQNNNSEFFVPNNQGTTRLSVKYTQPLLRGKGQVYNKSLTLLAKLDTKVARDEFERQLESHLLEVTRAYWSLYLERGTLLQKQRLEATTADIVRSLEKRQGLDTQQTQIASAQAALAERRSELIRARAAVKNAETRVRGLINAPQLGNSMTAELVPVEPPTFDLIPFDFDSSYQTAVQHRSEILQAMRQIKAGSTRLNMASHEILPILNAITEVYVAGLQGNSDVPQAWVTQFTDGAPSYTIGLQFEVPLGRRAARSRQTRRQIELRQLQNQYRAALESVKAEVDVAVREVQTAYDEMAAKQASVNAAKREVQTIEQRWRGLGNTNQSAALILESLLRAQERVTDTEFRLLTAGMTYNLALMNIKRAMGILVESENITAVQTTENGAPRTLLVPGH